MLWIQRVRNINYKKQIKLKQKQIKLYKRRNNKIKLFKKLLMENENNKKLN